LWRDPRIDGLNGLRPSWVNVIKVSRHALSGGESRARGATSAAMGSDLKWNRTDLTGRARPRGSVRVTVHIQCHRHCEDVYAIRFKERRLVAAKSVVEIPCLRTRNDNGPESKLDQKTLVLRIVVRPEHLMKRDSPARAVIAPEPHDVRRLLFLPGLRLRAVLFFKRKRRVKVHAVFLSPRNGRTTLVLSGN